MTDISKDDLFVLCCLWDARAYRHHIASENAGIRFNISYKPLDAEGSINKLARLNLIDARRFAGESGKHDAFPFLRAPGKNEDMIIGLTPNGGKLWESRLDPCWRDYIGSDTAVVDGNDYCSIHSFDRSVLQSLLDGISERDHAGGLRAEIIEAENIIYWKEGQGYAAIFMSQSGTPIDISGAQWHEIVYGSLDAARCKFNADLSFKIQSLLNGKYGEFCAGQNFGRI